MNSDQATKSVEEIFSLYEKYGSEDYIGEPVSQLEHMSQAAERARAAGYDDEVVLAAFFHDFGHLCEHVLPVKRMDNIGVADHEKIGARYLKERGFSDKICNLVQSHVKAKRYLTYKYPDYFEKLSEASKKTLLLQGGKMSHEEATIFESDCLHPLYIKLREWDDLAKETNIPEGPLKKYRDLALQHLIKQ
ncbi:MAG: HD domain-containing protein [Flavisolibacter sp.]